MSPLPFIIDITAQSGDWDLPQTEAERAITAVWPLLTAPKSGELSIALMDDAAITALNKTYRGKDKATNVLSFPAIGAAQLLGDIALSYDTIAAEAKSAGKTFGHHTSHLLIHGFLHLQGYDHETDAQAREMEALEIKALASLGIDNPYEIRKT